MQRNRSSICPQNIFLKKKYNKMPPRGRSMTRGRQPSLPRRSRPPSRTPAVTVTAPPRAPSSSVSALARRVAGLTLGARRRKPTYKLVKGQIGGLPSFSRFKLYNQPSSRVKIAKKIGAPNIWITNNPFQIVNAEGFQNAGVCHWGSLVDMITIGTKVPDATLKVRQFYLESVTGEMLMSNSSLATQYVDIYDIVRKRDCGLAPGGVLVTGDPIMSWKYGVSDQDPAGPNLTDYQAVTSKPTDSRLFNDYFTVVQKSRVGLAAGATHRHRVNYAINKVIDTELLNRANGDLAGYTVYTMVVINGQPASVKDASGAVVTTATTALDGGPYKRWSMWFNSRQLVS